MNVYVTFEKNGYDGTQIEKIFADEADAQDHIIETQFKNNGFYKKMERHELEEMALGQIETHEVLASERTRRAG